MATHPQTPSIFDGLTRQSMRLLVRIYVFDGAPYGRTVAGLFQYWRDRSASWRSAGTLETRASIEALLIRQFQREDLCAIDGSLRDAS